MLNKRKCPICGGGKADRIKHICNIVPEDCLLPYGTEADIVMCHDCGFIYHDVSENINAAAYYSIYTGSGEIKEYIVKEDERRLNLGCTEFLCRNGLSNQDFVLDIGCSYGVLLSLLKDRGFHNIYGMDEDKSAIAYLKRNGFKVHEGSIFDEGLPEFEGKFDFIVLRFILEHLYEPRKAIQNVERWLKPGGSIMIVLPDLSSYYESEPFPGYYVEFEHINHFTLNSVVNLMRDWDLRAYEKDSEFYPVMRILLSKKEKPVIRNIYFDGNGLKYFERHLNECNKRAAGLMDKIHDLKKNQTEVALWGGGNFVYRLLTHTPLKDCNIKYIVDNSEKIQGSILNGRRIIAPAEFVKEPFTGTIVISGKNSIDSIKRDIKNLNVQNPVICLSE
ncbi:class I SAM-dependent methyltransferase [Hungatella hathewayi]|uniref:class I SAM-dependent methyltransferase n=1 Tax=Hungatella hathewayi TaxID=154046 RepID=UPI0035625F49